MCLITGGGVLAFYIAHQEAIILPSDEKRASFIHFGFSFFHQMLLLELRYVSEKSLPTVILCNVYI